MACSSVPRTGGGRSGWSNRYDKYMSGRTSGDHVAKGAGKARIMTSGPPDVTTPLAAPFGAAPGAHRACQPEGVGTHQGPEVMTWTCHTPPGDVTLRCPL